MNPKTYVGIGLVAAIAVFLRGFESYFKWRRIDAVPLVPINIAGKGLIRVRGVAEAAKTILSPVSGTPCCFYRVDVKKWVEGVGGFFWSLRLTATSSASFEHFCSETDGLPFNIVDDSGRILVDLRGAEFDLDQTAERVLDGTSNSIDARLADLEAAVSGKAQEPCVQPSERQLRAYVSGIETAHSEQPTDHGGAQVLAALIDLLSEIGDPEVDSPEHRLDLMQRLIQARIASGDPRTYRVPEALEKYRGELAATAAHQATLSAADEKYKLTEYCVIPNKTYEVVGTCAGNPPKNRFDRCESDFEGAGRFDVRVCSKTLDETEEVRYQAVIMMWGGGAATLLCLCIFLRLFHLL
jgi:hypothetical protein